MDFKEWQVFQYVDDDWEHWLLIQVKEYNWDLYMVEYNSWSSDRSPVWSYSEKNLIPYEVEKVSYTKAEKKHILAKWARYLEAFIRS